MLAISGGVDSSTAAWLLKEEGYEVTGVTMCLGVREEGSRVRCCGQEAIEDAREVCMMLSIPHYVLDFAPLLEKWVIDKFIQEYRRGRTPNPCIDCNQHLKFGHLLNRALAMGFDYLAIGHYAKIERKEERWGLMRSKDKAKDQTYFLYPIPAPALKHIPFPLADRTKNEAREIARQAGLPIAEKPESRDLCFVPQDSYREFLQKKSCPVHPGPVIDRHGRILGKHSGTVFYTIGQRRGLRISSPFPLYVVDIDAAGNSVIVGKKEDIYAPGLVAGELNWLTAQMPEEAQAKIRHRQKTFPCRITPKGERIRVCFAWEQDAVTPGQSIVFYHGEQVLGGGIIEEVLRRKEPEA